MSPSSHRRARATCTSPSSSSRRSWSARGFSIPRTKSRCRNTRKPSPSSPRPPARRCMICSASSAPAGRLRRSSSSVCACREPRPRRRSSARCATRTDTRSRTSSSRAAAVAPSRTSGRSTTSAWRTPSTNRRSPSSPPSVTSRTSPSPTMSRTRGRPRRRTPRRSPCPTGMTSAPGSRRWSEA